MIENLDLSEIPQEHDTSNLSKQSSLRQLHEQTSNVSGVPSNYYLQQQQQIPSLNHSAGRRVIPNQGQMVSPYILQSPTSQNQSSNAPLPPNFKRENANAHSIKRSRQPIFQQPYQSNSLSRNQSPSQHIYVQHNMSSGNLSGVKATTNPTIPNINPNSSLGQIKTDSFHTCVEQTNNFSTANQHQNSLLFRKFNHSFEKSDQKGPAALQSPYLTLDKNEQDSFMSVNSNQNINTPSANPSTNTNINQITRRIFSNTIPSNPINRLSPQRQSQLESPIIQTIESKPIQLDASDQMQDIRMEMMKYADSFFQSLKRDVQDNFANSLLDLTKFCKKKLGENRVLAKPQKIDNRIIENKVEQIVEQRLKKMDRNQKEIIEQITNMKKEIKVRLDQSLSEALQGRAVNSMVENKIEILKSDLETNQRQKLDSLNSRCVYLENNYQNAQLFEDLNEFARNRASIYENKLLNLENLLNQFKKTIDDKINIGDIKGQFKEIVEQKAYQIQEEIDQLKLQPQFSNSSLKQKNEVEQKLKQLERHLNDQLYSLDTEQKLHINNKPDMDRVNKAEEKMMRFNQDMKVLQTWYTKLNQDFQKIRVNNESNEQLLKQFEELNERINVLHSQQQRLSNTNFKYENNEVEGLYRELQKINKNLHEIDEYKKQKFELLEKKLNSSKEEMDRKIQNIISSINSNKQPVSSLQNIPGLRIKMKQPDSAQKQKSLPSSDSNLTIYQTTNSTQKSINTQPAMGMFDTNQYSSENYSNKNSIVSSVNNSYVYNQKQQPFVHPPGRQPLQITQMSQLQQNDSQQFSRNQPSSQLKEDISDEQILINSNKHLRTSFTTTSKQQLQSQSSSTKQNSEFRPTKYKFSEQFNDDDDDFEDHDSGKHQRIELNVNSSEDEEEEIHQIQVSTQRRQSIEQQKFQQQPPQYQESTANIKNSQQLQDKNRFQAYSITNEEIRNELPIENVYNPLENRLKSNRGQDFDQNNNINIVQSNHIRQDSIPKTTNKQFFQNQDQSSQLIQKSGMSRDSDPINFDFVDGIQKSGISSGSSNTNTPFNRITSQQNQYQQQQDQMITNYATFSNNANTLSSQQNYQRPRQGSSGNIQNNKVENPYIENLYQNSQSNSQSMKLQEQFQKSLQIKDPSIPNQMGGSGMNYQSIAKMNQQQSQQTPQFNNQFGFNNDNQKQGEQRNKSDSSFATPAGSLNNSYELQQDQIYKKDPMSYMQYQQQQLNKNQPKQPQDDKKGLKHSQIQNPDQSQNLEDLLDQFEDFNENNIDAMSNSGEFYEEEGSEEMYSYQNSTPNGKFNRTQGLSTLKNAQLNQINEEEGEEESSHLGFSYANQNKISINSNKNNARNSDQSQGNNIKNSGHVQEYVEVINSVKLQNNIFKIVDQIQRLLELKNEKKLRCHRDEVGYLKDANGFYIFDTEGRMIKTDKETIKYLQTEGYIQLL